MQDSDLLLAVIVELRAILLRPRTDKASMVALAHNDAVTEVLRNQRPQALRDEVRPLE